MPDPSSSQSEDLIRLAKYGSIDAFERVYLQYYPQICMYLTHLIDDEADAQDLAQETLLNAWKSLLALEENRCFKAWLYRIATNVAYRYLNAAEHKNKNQFWLSWEEHGQLLLIEDVHSLGFEERIVERVIIRRALAHVSPRPRTCLLLYIVEDFQQKEIASILGMEVKHVSTYIQRGLAQLSKAYFKLEEAQGIPGKGRSV